MDFNLSQRLVDSLSPEDEVRLEVMKQILSCLQEYPLAFKGGSAIMFFYQGDRFSEDLDFDAFVSPDEFWVSDVVEKLNKRLNLKVSVAKDTSTTKRIKVLDDRFRKGVKVEISFRNVERLRKDLGSRAKGLRVYSVDILARLKLKALEGRQEGRDLYDLAFIIDFWSKSLKEDTLKRIASFLNRESIEDLASRFEGSFLEDERLGEAAFYLSYSRLISGKAKIEVLLRRNVQQQEALKKSWKSSVVFFCKKL